MLYSYLDPLEIEARGAAKSVLITKPLYWLCAKEARDFTDRNKMSMHMSMGCYLFLFSARHSIVQPPPLP